VLWGAPRIHGELLNVGFAVAQSTVAKYMAGTDDRPSGQRWGAFLAQRSAADRGHGAMGIRDKPIAADSTWQNSFAEG
jgi:hypothetical protein